MEKVSYADLFDFSKDSEVQKAIQVITQLLSTYQKLADGMSAQRAKYQSEVTQIVSATEALKKQLATLNPLTKEHQAQIAAGAQASGIMSNGYANLTAKIDNLIRSQKKYKTEQDEVLAKFKETIKLQNEEAALKAKLFALDGQRAKSIEKIKQQIVLKNKAMRDEAKEALGLVTIYDKEVKRLTELQRQFKAVAIAEGENSKAARALKKDMDQLYNSILKVEKAAGQHQRNVGNYSSALYGLGNAAKSFLAAFGIVGGVTMLAYLIRDTYQLIKQSEGLDKALRQVTETSYRYTQQVAFLRDMSDRYGIQLNLLTDSYTKFYVSTKGTNLEGEQTQKIFSSVVKSLASMSASTEDTDRALRALYQMISKGKIQAEELRGQLGDALPGAFQVMAKSLNVTTAELDKMLKEGKLMADEVLPNFAIELEKTFGVDNLQRIDTLSAAQTRLTNAWIEFVKAIEDGEGPIAAVLINSMKLTSDLLKGMTNFRKFVFGEDSEKLIDEKKKQNEILTKSQDIFSTALLNGIKTYDEFNERVVLAAETEEDRLKILGEVNKMYDEYIKKYSEASDEIKEQTPLLESLNNKLKTLEDTRKELYTEDDLKRNQIQIELLKQEIDRINNLATAYKNLETRLDGIKSKGGTSISGVSPGALPDELPGVPAAVNSVSKFKQGLSKFGLAIADIFETGFTLASTAVNQFFTNASIRQQNALTEFENKQDAEIAALEKRQEKELENERLTTEQKKVINERYASQIDAIEKKTEERRRQTQIKQARAAKAQSSFNIVLSTAEAIIKYLALGNVGLSVAAGIIGAAQLAAVASEPLPAFFKGTDDAPAGAKIVGEKGRELWVEPSGKIGVTGKKAEVRTDIPEHSKIIPADLTKKILEGYQLAETPGRYADVSAKLQKIAQQDKVSSESISKAMKSQREEIESMFGRIIGALEINNWSFTDKGQVTKSVQRGNTIQNRARLDSKY